MSTPQAITTELRTVEDRESAERTKAELKKPDPKPEKALGVLTDAGKTDEQKTN